MLYQKIIKNNDTIQTIDCFMYTVPEENKIYCSCCENETPEERQALGFSIYQRNVIKPEKQSVAVSVQLTVCKNCADSFARYGCD